MSACSKSEMTLILILLLHHTWALEPLFCCPDNRIISRPRFAQPYLKIFSIVCEKIRPSEYSVKPSTLTFSERSIAHGGAITLCPTLPAISDLRRVLFIRE